MRGQTGSHGGYAEMALLSLRLLASGASVSTIVHIDGRLARLVPGPENSD